MARVQPGRDGGWQVTLGRGGTVLQRSLLPDRAAAEAWAAMAAEAIRRSTIRIGSKRFLGTPAEALRRWAVDQGTLPRAEGGTHLAPVKRLADLIGDADCALPLAALRPTDLAALRGRRQAALGGPGPMLAEQAALAAALAEFQAFHLPALDNPFLEMAPDGLCVLEDAVCAEAMAWAFQLGVDLGRLVELVLITGAPASALIACRHGQADRRTGTLALAEGPILTLPPNWLPPEAAPAAPLLPALREPADLAGGFAALACRLRRPDLRPETLQLTGLTFALRQGRHLDEILPLTR